MSFWRCHTWPGTVFEAIKLVGEGNLIIVRLSIGPAISKADVYF